MKLVKNSYQDLRKSKTTSLPYKYVPTIMSAANDKWMSQFFQGQTQLADIWR